MSDGRLYKITGPDGAPLHGGDGYWPLPKVDRLGRTHRGKWRTVHGPLKLCANGLHLVEERDVRRWLRAGCVVWVAEGRGERDEGVDKIAFREARLIEPVVHFAASGPFSLHEFEKTHRQPTEADFRAWQQAIDDADAVFEGRRRLTFGYDRLPDARQAICPAWPSMADFARRFRRRTNAALRAA